jgi:hypothetical protein
MRLFIRYAPVCAVVLWLCSITYAQSALTDLTSNNTSGCSTAAGNCQAAFTGMSDSTSGVFNAAPASISHADIHASEYGNATTAIFVHFMPWFCMQSGSTATGAGTSCNGHVQVGYNSSDPATVKSQMSDIAARGFQGPIIDWYGPSKTIEDQSTLAVKNELESRCVGTACPLSFALTEDQGSFNKQCPSNGNGTDQTNCIIAKVETDLDYANSTYFQSPAYLRVDTSTMTLSPSGNPVLFFFVCESCFTNPTPDWTTIFNTLKTYAASYPNGPVRFIFRNSGAFTHPATDGGFAWVNHYGSNDPYGLVYLDNFYNVSLTQPAEETWGASWKGFDNTLAQWHPTVSITPQQCGKTWVQTLAEMTHNNDYSISRQLPFLQVVTWNDYDEGSEIETGIDNCLSLTASASSGNLSWTPSFSASSGSESTVDHYEIYNSLDGQTVSLLATVPVGTHAVPLSSMNIAAGAQTFYVEAVGKNTIQNKLSNAVSYTPAPSVAITSVSPNSGTADGGTSVTISGTGFQSGATVSIGGTNATVSSNTSTALTVSTPAHAAGTVDVVVTNPDGTGATASAAYSYVAAPSFTITASNKSKTVKRPNNATFSFTVKPNNGFSGTVTFSVTGVPTNGNASFSPTSVTTSGSTTLTISNTKSVQAGTYKLNVVGTSSAYGGLSASTIVTLTLK